MKKQILMLISLFLANGSMNLLTMEPSIQEINQRLIQAAEQGNIAKVQDLLAAQANPNATIQNGNTPLIFAAARGHKKVVGILLAAGANPSAVGEHGFTPLIAATEFGHKDIVKILLAAKAEINIGKDDGSTPLHVAAGRGDKNIVEILLVAGADPTIFDKFGGTPLHSAAINGNEDILQILLAAGVDPNIADEYMTTPLHNAAQRGRENIVKKLLAAGANPAINNTRNKMPSDVAKTSQIKNYIEEKMKISKELHTGAKMGRTDIMRNALKNGALINMPDENGNTALHLAIMNGNLDAVKYLLQFAPSINFSLKNNKGQTVIDPALGVGTLGAIELIQQATVKK